MLVCHCQAVCDRAIRKAIRDGARTRRQVARACAAGGRCGGCRPAIDAIIEAEVKQHQAAKSVGSLPDIVAAG